MIHNSVLTYLDRANELMINNPACAGLFGEKEKGEVGTEAPPRLNRNPFARTLRLPEAIAPPARPPERRTVRL